MWPTRCGKPLSGTCSPTCQGAGTVRRGSGRGGTSPASPGGPAPTPKPNRCGKPTPVGHPRRASGHLSAPALPASVTAPRPLLACPGGSSILAQPARLPAPKSCEQVVAAACRGAGGGVHRAARWGSRAAGAACPRRWAVDASVPFPGRPDRVAQDRPGAGARPPGARWVAFLRTSAGASAGYQAPSTQARRTQIPTDRRAGVDANVSNLALASFPADRPEHLSRPDHLHCRPTTGRGAGRTQSPGAAEALDRSRRNTNSDQYGPSPRQQTRAAPRRGRVVARKG